MGSAEGPATLRGDSCNEWSVSQNESTMDAWTVLPSRKVPGLPGREEAGTGLCRLT